MITNDLLNAIAQYNCVGVAAIAPNPDLSGYASPVALATYNGQLYRLDFTQGTSEEDIDAAIAQIENFTPPAEPEWSAFRLGLYQNVTWQRVLGGNPVVASVLVAALWNFQSNPELAPEIKALWDSLIPATEPALSTQEIATLNDLASSNNIPLSLASNGTLVLPV